jgi:hypothetical protein
VPTIKDRKLTGTISTVVFITTFVPLLSPLLYSVDKVPENNRRDTFHDKKPGLPMPHSIKLQRTLWSDKHTRGEECQPSARKETAVPLDQYAVAKATRVSKYTSN